MQCSLVAHITLLCVAGSLAENVFLVARLSNLGHNLTKHAVSYFEL
jgi:hypothetical protein